MRAARAARGACVRSRQSGSATSVGCVCLWGCAAQGVPCKRAVGLQGGRCTLRGGSHCGGARRARVLCCHAVVSWIRSLATSSRAGGKLLGVRHTARRKVRRAVCPRARGIQDIQGLSEANRSGRTSQLAIDGPRSHATNGCRRRQGLALVLIAASCSSAFEQLPCRPIPCGTDDISAHHSRPSCALQSPGTARQRAEPSTEQTAHKASKRFVRPSSYSPCRPHPSSRPVWRSLHARSAPA